MPKYKDLFDSFPKDREDSRKRSAAGLLKLRRELAKQIPRRTVEETLLLATWNLREFGSGAKFGPRLDESIQYIAEIINHFDLVALQEVHDNLADLHRLLTVLGDWWEYLVTDVGAQKGANSERIAFLYDKRKVRFDHMAGEITVNKDWQLARTPYICTFRSGWRRFSLCSVHIYYGEAKAIDKRRLEEIETLAKLLADRGKKRQDKDNGEPETTIVLGDFNIFSTEDATYKALTKHGFKIPVTEPTNIGADKHFDQIAFHDPRNLLWPKNRDGEAGEIKHKGVFRFFESVFRDTDVESYAPEMQDTNPDKFKKAADQAKFYKQWRTFQMSDHNLLWVELKIDFADRYIPVAGHLVERKKK